MCRLLIIIIIIQSDCNEEENAFLNTYLRWPNKNSIENSSIFLFTSERKEEDGDHITVESQNSDGAEYANIFHNILHIRKTKLSSFYCALL